MERVENQLEGGLVDLGSVTEETKGNIAPLGDTVGLSQGGGLSDD